jgi:hypothetical protein
MDPVVENQVRGLTEKEKMDLIELWLLEALEENRSGKVRVNIGRGHVTLSRSADNWYTSNGSCYPNHIESDPECDCGCRDGW